MKQFAVKIMMVLAFTVTTVSTYGQNAENMLRRRAAEKVGQFGDYLKFIANPQKSQKARNYYRLAALNLFISKGESYYEIDENDERIYKEGVMMEVTSVNRKGSTKNPVRKYLQNLMAMKAYTRVDISTTEVSEIQVSKLRPISENQYVCTCYFEQAFCGYSDGKPIYKDITRKKIDCYVIVEDTEEGQEYIVLLGDVTALETRRV